MNRTSVSIYEVQDELINENTKIIFAVIDQYQRQNKIVCSCKECILDIAAITLNTIKPRYSVSLIGEFYKTPEAIKAFAEEIETALEKAIAIVKERPHHE